MWSNFLEVRNKYYTGHRNDKERT
ncbi:MAG: hypothetical protein ACP5T2_02690 [Thermoprotei archaeon]